METVGQYKDYIGSLLGNVCPTPELSAFCILVRQFHTLRERAVNELTDNHYVERNHFSETTLFKQIECDLEVADVLVKEIKVLMEKIAETREDTFADKSDQISLRLCGLGINLVKLNRWLCKILKSVSIIDVLCSLGEIDNAIALSLLHDVGERLFLKGCPEIGYFGRHEIPESWVTWRNYVYKAKKMFF